MLDERPSEIQRLAQLRGGCAGQGVGDEVVDWLLQCGEVLP